MVHKFSYRGEIFRATVHGLPGKEEIFVIYMLDDNEEGPEISLDRFEDHANDPNQPLDEVLVMLVDKLFKEQDLIPSAPDEAFAWIESKTNVRVHGGANA